MRALLVLSCLVVATFAADKPTYSSKYDNFDVETLIGNDRLLRAYVNCFLDKGRCTPEGADFKSKFILFYFFKKYSVIIYFLSSIQCNVTVVKHLNVVKKLSQSSYK